MNVHLWNTGAVATDLARGRVSESDACGYLLALALLYVGEYYLGVFVVPPIEWFLLYEFVVVATLTIFGMYRCFLANGGNRGRDFILRFTCISLPISVKLSLVASALIYVFYHYPEAIVDAEVFADPEQAWRAITIVWLAAFTGIFYWRVWFHLRLLGNDTQQITAGDV